MAIQARETYGDNLSPIRAHLKKTPRNLRDRQPGPLMTGSDGG